MKKIIYNIKRFLIKYDLYNKCPVCKTKLIEVGYPKLYGFLSYQKIRCPKCDWNLNVK